MLFSCCLSGGTAKECFPAALPGFTGLQLPVAGQEGIGEDRRVLMDSAAGRAPCAPQDRELLPSHVTGSRTPSVPQVGHQEQPYGVGDAGSSTATAELC